MSADFSSLSREELEAKLTALLLGELPELEAGALRERLATDADLARKHRQLERTLALVREAVAQPAGDAAPGPALPRLSAEKRDRLLARLREPAASVSVDGAGSPVVIPVDFPGAPLVPSGNVWLALAACLVALIGFATFLLGRPDGPMHQVGVTYLSAAPAAKRGAPGVRFAMTNLSAAATEEPSASAESPNGLETKAKGDAPGRQVTRFYRVNPQAFDSGLGVVATPAKDQEAPGQGGGGGLGGGTGGGAGGGGVAEALGRTGRGEAFFYQGQGVAVAREPAGAPRYGLAAATAEGVRQADGAKKLGKAVQRELASPPGASKGVEALAENPPVMPPAPASVNRPERNVLSDSEVPAAGLELQVKETLRAKLKQETPAGPASIPTILAVKPEMALSLPAGGRAGGDNTLQEARQQASVVGPAKAVGLVMGDQPTVGRLLAAGNAAAVPAAPSPGEALPDRDSSVAGLPGALEGTPPSFDRAAGDDTTLAIRLGKADAADTFDYAVRSQPARGTLAGTAVQLGESERFGNFVAADSDEGKRPADPARSLDRSQAQARPAPVPAAAPVPPVASVPEPQPEVATAEQALSTFSLNVTDVSFKLAGASLEQGALPSPATIRSEEFLNAFQYRDPEPVSGLPVGFTWERARYPFAHNREVLRLAVNTAAQGREAGRPLNLVLAVDNSGSMERADRVRILRESMRTLAAQLHPADRISVVSFARLARLWIDGLPGDRASEIVEAVGNLSPEGGTNLEDALRVAYETALKNFQAGGVNRVVLLTDGAANLGDVNPDSLRRNVESYRRRGVALDCFGIGWEGYHDDLLETLSHHGDGRYGFVNTPEEAGAGFASQLAGALQVAASDVKVQVEFNPRRVLNWRQVGYAKHQLTAEQFRDNTVDAAELGAAEAGNALYLLELDPRGDGPVGTTRLRYRVPATGVVEEHEWVMPFNGPGPALEQSAPSLRLAVSAAALAESLAGSPFAGEVTAPKLLQMMAGVPGEFAPDPRPAQLETMIRQTAALRGE